MFPEGSLYFYTGSAPCWTVMALHSSICMDEKAEQKIRRIVPLCQKGEKCQTFAKNLAWCLLCNDSISCDLTINIMNVYQ